MTFQWDPNRGDPTKALAHLFDRFYDANQLGLPDAQALGSLSPAIEFITDETGHGGHIDASTLSACTMRKPSTKFASNNDGVTITTQYGVIVGHENVSTDTIQVSSSIRPLSPSGTGEQKCTVVMVAAISAHVFPTLVPYTYANGVDSDSHVFGADTNWITGSVNDPANSATVVNTNAHLLIFESGTSSSGVEVDGVPGTLTDLSAVTLTVPDVWKISGAGEFLFIGVLLGTLNTFQKQDIRDWVNNNVSTITVV